MKKTSKLLSVMLSGAMALSAVNVPVSADTDNTVTKTYSPSNWLVRYGSESSHTKMPEIAVNRLGVNKVGKEVKTTRTDQDDMYSQYTILSPDMLKSLTINIPNLKLARAWPEKDEEGNPVEQTMDNLKDGIMGMSLYYSTTLNDLPADGVYYTYNDGSNDITQGGTKENVDELLAAWKDKLFFNRENANVLIGKVSPSTFGITDAPYTSAKNVNNVMKQYGVQTTKAYDVSKDITDVVIEDLKAGEENNQVKFDVIYRASNTYGLWEKNNNYYVDDATYHRDATLTAVYDVDKIAADVNTAQNAAELKAKVVEYAPLFDVDVTLLRDDVLEAKLATYVGTSFTADSFKAMLAALKPIDSSYNTLDLSGVLNMDILAPEGSAVEKSFSGYGATIPQMWKDRGYSNGVIKAQEGKIETVDGSKKFVPTGTLIPFAVDEKGFEAGVKDSIILENAQQNAVTVQASGEKAEKLYIAWDVQGSYAGAVIKVNYADGTSETNTIKLGGRSWQADGSYPNYAGVVMDNVWSLNFATTENGKGKYIVESKDNVTAGLGMFAIDLDTTKTPVSYEFSGKDYSSVIYAITEATMSNADMQAVIEQARALDYVLTEENAELARKAYTYAEELVKRNVALQSDFEDIANLVKQAAAQENAYLDITDKLDSDIVVSINDGENTRSAGYSGKDDFLIQPIGDTIVLNAPSDKDYLDYETGSAFKVTGNKGNGNDSVKIALEKDGGTGVTFALDGKMLKHVSFLIDSANEEGINGETGSTAEAIVNYTDGTSEQISTVLSKTNTWYTGQYRANIGVKYAHYDSVTNTYKDGFTGDYPHSTGATLVALGFDLGGYTHSDSLTEEAYSSYKTVESIKLLPHATANYYVLAATTQAYSNDVLVSAMNKIENVTEVSEVTKDNAQDVINAVNAMEELYKRAYLSKEDYDSVMSLKEAAEALQGKTILKFTPSVDVSGDNAIANLEYTNTTDAAQDYVLIIAAYDSNNKLVGVNSKSGTAEVNTTDSDSVSIAKPSNAASYKAFVWDGIKTMKPLAVD